MATPKEILKEAIDLSPSQKAELIDSLLSSLDCPDRKIDELWPKEVEGRIDAYERGEIKTVTLVKILKRYN